MKFLFLLSSVFLLSARLPAQTNDNLYSFFVAGHTYGKPGVDNPGLHPPFEKKFGYINNIPNIQFGILTGDIVSPNPDVNDWIEVDSKIDSLGIPVYFAVGNHDMENRPVFEERYGNTYFCFTHSNDLFIILDPNIDQWNISGEQLTFLRNTISENHQSVDNIFVFFHQLLWWEKNNTYKKLHPNSFAGRADTINFWSEIIPLFKSIPNHTVFFAGDMGAASWSDDFMYDAFDNIELICSGMGEGVGDNFVVVNVNSSKNIDYDLICLNDTTTNCFGKLKDYTISTSKSNIKKHSCKAFPNPATKYLTLEFNPTMKNPLIQIFDLNSRCVYEKVYCNEAFQTINLKKLNKGVYFLVISDDKQKEILKFINN
ncbi:MAG: T9SS type A sorting domain-containing protein [Prolixibacteraceae bacterium]|jgi:hypothetical protein|nr:T9SS type A sorting domain-containing protein [Prolixibacteraceae bacterium]